MRRVVVSISVSWTQLSIFLNSQGALTVPKRDFSSAVGAQAHANLSRYRRKKLASKPVTTTAVCRGITLPADLSP